MTLNFALPISEVTVMFSRSSGPGGQNVNKVATKVQLEWRINETKTFNLHQQELIKTKAASLGYLTTTEKIILSEQSTRSQEQNRERAFEKLSNLIRVALTPRRKRVPTKPSRGVKERRFQDKKATSKRKSLRRTRPTSND